MSNPRGVDAPPPSPPLLRRAAFWTLSWRLPAEYRPWVAHQVQRPDYPRRRQAGLLVLFVVFVGGPQLLPGNHGHGWQVALPLLPVAVVAVTLLMARPLTDAQRAQVLAFHGVDAAGRPVPADQRWTGIGHPLVLGVLVTLTLSVTAVGIAVAADREAQPQCGGASMSALASLRPLVDKPLPGIFIPAQFQHVQLRNPRQVGTRVRGIHYLAADVVDDHHDVLGAAAWRVIDPDNAYGWPAGVDAINALAAEITPTAGYATSGTDGHRDRLPGCLHAD